MIENRHGCCDEGIDSSLLFFFLLLVMLFMGGGFGSDCGCRR